MARKEVLVQLDDELVRRLDALAARLGLSRSELLRRGAQAVLEAEELAAADRRLVEAYRARPQDPTIVAAAARLAAENAGEAGRARPGAPLRPRRPLLTGGSHPQVEVEGGRWSAVSSSL